MKFYLFIYVAKISGFLSCLFAHDILYYVDRNVTETDNMTLWFPRQMLVYLLI